jgi:hypothetical protein
MSSVLNKVRFGTLIHTPGQGKQRSETSGNSGSKRTAAVEDDFVHALFFLINRDLLF